jgi:hypothetical protein
VCGPPHERRALVTNSRDAATFATSLPQFRLGIVAFAAVTHGNVTIACGSIGYSFAQVHHVSDTDTVRKFTIEIVAAKFQERFILAFGIRYELLQISRVFIK